jgi:Na+/pantothenate symporter
MNIDYLIIPRFKRFQSMNLGLKRMLFLLTFIPALGFIGAILWFMYFENMDGTDGLLVFAISVSCYVAFWTFIRTIYWIVDGFTGVEKQI